MDLIEPGSKEEIREALRAAGERGTRVSIVGGKTHADKGDPCEVDMELATSRLDRVVAYDPAEMLAVVEAGMRIGDLRRVLAEGGQEWPADAPDEATVGGTIATAPSSPRRLRMGPLRDTVVEMELVTGDGRLVRSGARTVKSVAGFDVHRLATGSLGTLGAIVQVAVKVRPLPKARRLLVAFRGGVAAGRSLLDAVPLPSSVAATPDRVEIALEGWPDEIEEQTAAARRATGEIDVLEGEGTLGSGAIAAPTVVEVAVPPSKLEAVLDRRSNWRALMGVGIAWVGLADHGERLTELRGRVAEAGGIAPVVRGPGGLGDAPVPALEVHRRLKAAFDPAGILAPGRFWGGL
ncbi:MAG: FAD-binding protein [Actinomycetota bacterium]|nr:FAD-binding protein [Actinomycetota bacterium]